MLDTLRKQQLFFLYFFADLCYYLLAEKNYTRLKGGKI